MAQSVQKTKWSQNNPTERVKTNEQAGRIRVAYATYEASAEQSTIEMFNLFNIMGQTMNLKQNIIHAHTF